MQFKGLDLNLLVTLDRLLTEKNVSRAAEKLCLSQSATSNALTKLREFFGDQLLVQVGRNMSLTPRAEQLAMPVRQALMQIDATIIDRPQPDLAKVEREIRIIASDYGGLTYLSDRIREMQKEAPGLVFTLRTPTAESTAQLSRGEVDFVLMPERFLTREQPSQNVFVDTYAAIVSRDNTAVADSLDLDTFMSLPHVTVRMADGPPNYETAIADLYGHRRKLDVIVGDFSMVPFMVIATNRVAIVFERLARLFRRFMPLRMLPCPMDLPPLRMGLQWHQLAESDKVLQAVKKHLLASDDQINPVVAQRANILAPYRLPTRA